MRKMKSHMTQGIHVDNISCLWYLLPTKHVKISDFLRCNIRPHIITKVELSYFIINLVLMGASKIKIRTFYWIAFLRDLNLKKQLNQTWNKKTRNLPLQFLFFRIESPSFTRLEKYLFKKFSGTLFDVSKPIWDHVTQAHIFQILKEGGFVFDEYSINT